MDEIVSLWKSQYIATGGEYFIYGESDETYEAYTRDVRNELLISIWRLQISS